jgi:hypothetical protein
MAHRTSTISALDFLNSQKATTRKNSEIKNRYAKGEEIGGIVESHNLMVAINKPK